MRKDARSSSAVVGIVCALMLAMAPTAGAHGGEFVDEYPDDPHLCGGAFTDSAYCLITVGGAPITVEIAYQADEPDATVWVHGELRIAVPDTPWGVLVVECERTGVGSSSCITEIGPELTIDLPPTYEFECNGHVHLPPRETGSGTFHCSTGDRLGATSMQPGLPSVGLR